MPPRHEPRVLERRARARAAALLAALAGTLASAADAPSSPPRGGGCLPAGAGYVHARIRGARNLDVSWPDAQLECAGEVRADGGGLLVSFVGAVHGQRLRLLFGVRARGAAGVQHALPTNLTVIFEGEHRLYATQGDDKCTVDELRGERLADDPRGARNAVYRVSARGFCVGPAGAPAGQERIVMESFDFTGRIGGVAASSPAAH